MKFGQIVNGVWRQKTMPGTATAYEEAYSVSSTITAGSNVTIPNSQSYDGSELFVFVNGQALYEPTDFQYVGTSPRTQVAFTFDLFSGDVILFKVG